MLAWLDLNRQIFAGDSHFKSPLPRATEALLTTTKHLNVPHMHICLVPVCSRSLSDKEPIGSGRGSLVVPADTGGSTQEYIGGRVPGVISGYRLHGCRHA
jgi:hypothetical protein